MGRGSMKFELPDYMINNFRKLENQLEGVYGEMTKAGAEVVKAKMTAVTPSKYQPFIKTSVTYKTPSDGGINTKIYFGGYLPFRDGRTVFYRRGANGQIYGTTKGIPVPFIMNLYQYGRSNAPFPRINILGRAMSKSEIIKAMQKKYDELIRKIR